MSASLGFHDRRGAAGYDISIERMGDNVVQQHYWKELHQLKTHIGFIELLLESAESKDLALKIILAVAASTSIGAWAIWKDLSWLWAFIIALSQVIAAVNHYLPYKERIKTYPGLIRDLEDIMIQAEQKWHSIAEGKLTSEEINIARFAIRTSKQKTLNKHITTTIPTAAKLHEKAESSSRAYLENFYLA